LFFCFFFFAQQSLTFIKIITQFRLGGVVMKQFVALILVAALLFGCVNISDTAKASAFGKNAKEQKALDYFTQKYGDPRGTGAPNIIEPIVTTSITDFMPADIVSKYSKDASAFYVWFFYDNFAEADTITITFKYLDDGTVIHAFNSKGGGDYGAGSFTLSAPDGGWPVGNYEVTVAGKGVSKSVKFEVIDGATVASPLPYETAAAMPGSDRDEHGCIGSAGYTWCAVLSKCIRSWEENCTAAPAQNQPATTAGMTSDAMFLDTGNNYLGGCSLTGTSKFTLDKPAQVSLLQVWYNWGAGESVITYTLEKDGSTFAGGSMIRADCDPYQGNWCNGNQAINKEFPAGSYTLTVSSAKMCLKPGATGIVRLYGKYSSTASAGSSSGSGLTGCSFVGQWKWTNHERVYMYEDGTMKAYDNGAQTATGTYTKQADGTYFVKWTPGWTGYFKLDSSCHKIVGANQYTADLGADKLSDSVTADTVLPAGTPVHLSNCVYSGKWNTDWGAMVLAQDGTKVTGTYEHDAGKLAGTLVDGVFVGKWTESPTYSEPGDGGDTVFYFTKDCNGFTGTWHYGVHTSGAWSGGWVGTKVA
jgi:hypothetical protein